MASGDTKNHYTRQLDAMIKDTAGEKERVKHCMGYKVNPDCRRRNKLSFGGFIGPLVLPGGKYSAELRVSEIGFLNHVLNSKAMIVDQAKERATCLELIDGHLP